MTSTTNVGYPEIESDRLAILDTPICAKCAAAIPGNILHGVKELPSEPPNAPSDERDAMQRAEIATLREKVAILENELRELVKVLRIAEAHVDWGDCSLENVHRKARLAIEHAKTLGFE